MLQRYCFLFIIGVVFNISCMAQPANFAPRGVGGGGALYFPRINPANDSEFYVACDMSEMFHSTDFGKTYTQINFTKLQALNVSTYEFTSNANIAYSNFNDGNNGYPVKTTDGGNTWVQLPGFDANQGEVYAMKANYNNPQQILLNYYGQIVISNDSGNTFALVKQATNNGVGIILGGVFFDGDSIYIGTNEGILYSANGGASFSSMTTSGITAGEVIWQFAGAKTGNTTRFACITGTSANVYNGLMPYDYYGLAANVYTMDNASGTWATKSAGINFSNDYVMYIGMAVNDINTIYLGGNDNALGAGLVFKSADGGANWNKVFKTTNNQNIITGWSGYGGDKNWSWGETTFGITVAPNNSNIVMFGDYGFVHTTSDGGNNWKQAYINIADEHAENIATPQHDVYHSIGLENTSCWQVDWQSPTTMMAGYSDIGGIRSADSGNSWGFTYNGMSVNSVYRIAKTPAGTMFASTSGIHDMYQSTHLEDAQLDATDASGKIMYSADHGANWSALHTFNHPVFWIGIDPNDSNKMYASVIDYGGGGTGMQGGIWMTSNLHNLATSTWQQLPAPPRTQGHPACIQVLNDGKVLCTFSGRISSGSTFTASSGVFLYDPGTGTWSDVSDANMWYWTKDIVINPSDTTQNTWYAGVFTNWGSTASNQGGLYKTTDRGTSWTKLTGTQFARVTSLTFDPQNYNQAYLTTETQGLWMSSNMNAAQPTWLLVATYPFRQPERVYFNPYNPQEMWVSSFGNGMKMGNLSSITGVPVFSNRPGIVIYPNPAKNVINLSLSTQSNRAATVSVYDISGKLMSVAPAGNSKNIQLDIHLLPAGTYIIAYGNETGKFIKVE